MNRITRASAVSIALVASLALAACDENDADGQDSAEFDQDATTAAPDETTDDTAEESPDDDTGDTQADDVTGDDPAQQDGEAASGDIPAEYDGVLAAIELAATDAGGRAFELDDEDGGWEIYVEVDGIEVEVEVNREGTEILGQDPDDDGLDSDEQALLDAAGDVTMADALRLAIIEHGGTAPVDEIEVGFRDGVAVWEVDFHDDVEVYVDPAAQQIVHVDR